MLQIKLIYFFVFLMKISLYIFVLMCICSCENRQQSSQNFGNQTNTDMDSTSLALNFDLERRERSKDSSTRSVKIEIKNGKATISKTYGGRDPRKDSSETLQIDAEKQAEIIEFLEQNKLNIDLEEIQTTEGIGISQTLNFEIQQPFQSKIFIKGRTNIWGVSKENRQTNIENITYFDKVNAFISLVLE
jgi:hypothetical protein